MFSLFKQLQTLHFCSALWCSLPFGLTEGPDKPGSCAVDERRGIKPLCTPWIPCRPVVTERLKALRIMLCWRTIQGKNSQKKTLFSSKQFKTMTKRNNKHVKTRLKGLTSVTHYLLPWQLYHYRSYFYYIWCICFQRADHKINLDIAKIGRH